MADVARLNLITAKGEARTYSGTHQTSATDTTPIDITGWTIKVTAKDEGGRVVLNKTATIVNGATGSYQFSVTHADTLVTPSAYRVDIQRTSGAETLMGLGTWTVTPEVLY